MKDEEADICAWLAGTNKTNPLKDRDDFACYRSKAMLRVLRCVETMGDVSLWAVFSCDGCMAARREGASRGDNTSGSVYTTCFSWSTSITTAPSSKRRSTQARKKARHRLSQRKQRRC